MLGHADDVTDWETVLTGRGDLVRPTVHGAPVLFHPNCGIET